MDIHDRQIAERFGTDEYQVLLVAEKFQTGFDQPLLHTMYVDKRLSGIQAVQTLSRLNRIYPGKEDTFVLDFVNEADEIIASFQPYYEQTVVGERSEAGHLYDLQAKLENYGVFHAEEVNEFAKAFYKPTDKQSAQDHERMNACIDPAVGRYKSLKPESKEEFKKTIIAYKNLYAFLAQVIPFQDIDLEKLYSYTRFLLTKLPKDDHGPRYAFEDDVALKYYRQLCTMNDSPLVLAINKKTPIDGSREAGKREERNNKIKLSTLIDMLNERFGTEFKPGDQLFFDSITSDAVGDKDLREAALVNTMENFGYVFKKSLDNVFIDRMEQNEEIAARFMNEKDFRDAVSKHLLAQVYDQIRSLP